MESMSRKAHEPFLVNQERRLLPRSCCSPLSLVLVHMVVRDLIRCARLRRRDCFILRAATLPDSVLDVPSRLRGTFRIVARKFQGVEEVQIP